MTNRLFSSNYPICVGIYFLGSLAFASAETTFPLLTNCFEDAERVADVATSDDVRVHYASAAGGAKSCYAVQVSKEGRSLNGFLVGATLPSIQRFEDDVRRHVPQPPAPAVGLAKAALVPPAPESEPLGPTSLAGLKGVDMYGRGVDLNMIPASHMIVYFWSASNKKSTRTAEEMEYIHGQFGGSTQKLEIVGVATAKDVEQLRQVCLQTEVTWRQILDRGQIANRYHVSPDKPYILLDRSRSVVAAVASPKELEVHLRRIGLK